MIVCVNVGDIILTDTVGIAVRDSAQGTNGNADITDDCDYTATTADGTLLNVVRENKAINDFDSGQILLEQTLWPFIQLYNLNPTGNVIVQYNKGGGAQTTTLTFDTVDQYADLEKDRDRYPQAAEVHLTLTDVQLNIDPTDEDSWSWAADDGNTYYALFNENGGDEADSGADAVDLNAGGFLDDFFCEDNCIFLMVTDAQGTGEVVTIVDNEDSATDGDGIIDADDVSTDGGSIDDCVGDDANCLPITFTELSPNTAIFSNYDEFDTANIRTTVDALRGTSATVDYNETPVSIVVGFEFASIDIQPIDDVWNSGEEIPVVLVDGDANLNTRVDEDLDVFSQRVDIIPALSTGSPFSFDEDTDFALLVGAEWAADGDPLDFNLIDATVPSEDADSRIFDLEVDAELEIGEKDVEDFSARAVLNTGPDAGPALIDLDMRTSGTEGSVLIVHYDDRTIADLKAVIQLPRGDFGDDFAIDPLASDDDETDFFGNNLFSFDFRSFNENICPDPCDDDPVDNIDIFLLVADAIDWTTIEDLNDDPEDFCLIQMAEDQDLQGQFNLADPDADGVFDIDFYEALYGTETCDEFEFEDDDEIGLLVFLDDDDFAF